MTTTKKKEEKEFFFVCVCVEGRALSSNIHTS